MPSVRASGAITVERGAGKTSAEKVTFTRLGGARAARAWARSPTSSLSALYDDSLSPNEGALTVPGYTMDGWYGRIFRGCGFSTPTSRSAGTQEGLHDLLFQGADQDQGRGDQPDL